MKNFDAVLGFYVNGLLKNLEDELKKGKAGTMMDGYRDAKEKMVNFFREVEPGYYWPRHASAIDGIVLNGQDISATKRFGNCNENSSQVYYNGFRAAIPETVSAIMLQDYDLIQNELRRNSIPK